MGPLVVNVEVALLCSQFAVAAESAASGVLFRTACSKKNQADWISKVNIGLVRIASLILLHQGAGGGGASLFPKITCGLTESWDCRKVEAHASEKVGRSP